MRQKVIFCGPTFAYPPIGGPELRVFNTMRALSKHNKITLVVWNDLEKNSKQICEIELEKLDIEMVQIQKKEIARLDIPFPILRSKLNTLFTLLIKFITREKQRQEDFIADELVRLTREKNIERIWFSYANISVGMVTRVKKTFPRVFLIADTDSVWSRYILRATPFLPVTKKINNVRKGLHKMIQERKLVRNSDLVTAVSEIDRDYYSKYSNDPEKVQLAYNVIDTEAYRAITLSKMMTKEHSVLLAGTYGNRFSPMDNAAEWFLKKVWPIVINKFPSASLYIVGRNSDKLWQTNHQIGLYVEGEVPSVLPFLEKCSLSVVPLWFESGTRFKILEAAASKLPVVTTTLGVEGLKLQHRKDVIIADTPAAFANAVIEIFETDIGKVISESAHTAVANSYGIQSLEKQVEVIMGIAAKRSRI